MRAWPIEFAATRIRSGGVIAYPTEAVWGLGCDPFNRDAVCRLLEIKQRPMDKGLILVAADISDVDPYLRDISPTQRAMLQQHWPGFKTWVIPDSGLIPPWIKGRHNGVAIRVSAHPLVQALCRAFGGLIVSTSANIAGRPAAVTRLSVEQYFGSSLDFVLPGSLGGAKSASRITDLETGQPLR